MIEKGRLSNIQAAMLAITSLTIMGHLILLKLVIFHSRQDGWISAIIGSILGLIGIIAVTKLSQRYPGLTLIEILMKHYSLLGKLLCLIYLVYFYIMTVLATKFFAETYKSIMDATPATAFITVILLLTAYIVFLGLETLGRMNQIMLPILVALAMVVVLLTLNNKDYSNLLPIMGRGIGPVALGALDVMAWFGEFIIMGMVLPYVQEPKKLMKANLMVGIVTVLFFIGPVTGPIAMFGAVEAAKMAFPTFSEVRYIEAGEVLNRFDAIAILFWTVGLMFRTALFFYGLCLGTAQFFSLPTYRPLIIPFAWLIGVGCFFLAQNFEEMSVFLFKGYVPLNILFGSAIPLVLSIFSYIMIKRKKKNESIDSSSS